MGLDWFMVRVRGMIMVDSSIGEVGLDWFMIRVRDRLPYRTEVGLDWFMRVRDRLLYRRWA